MYGVRPNNYSYFNTSKNIFTALSVYWGKSCFKFQAEVSITINSGFCFQKLSFPFAKRLHVICHTNTASWRIYSKKTLTWNSCSFLNMIGFHWILSRKMWERIGSIHHHFEVWFFFSRTVNGWQSLTKKFTFDVCLYPFDKYCRFVFNYPIELNLF